MKGHCIFYFEHRNDAVNIVKLSVENTRESRVFSLKINHACHVISILKINYAIAVSGMSVL